MTLRFQSIETEAQIEDIADVAKDIWYEYWPAIIGRKQTEYMVLTRQSPSAIAEDIAERGLRYFRLVDEEGETVGYTGAAVEDLDEMASRIEAGEELDPDVHGEAINRRHRRRLFISKIYLYAEQRGKHYATQTIRFWQDVCLEEGLPAMYLTVNKENKLGIRAYEGCGFENIESREFPVGLGFVMDDYVMMKEVG